MNFEKIEKFFSSILQKLEKRKNDEKCKIQNRRLQLLQEAVEENEYETLEVFFDLIQQKRLNFDPNDRTYA